MNDVLKNIIEKLKKQRNMSDTIFSDFFEINAYSDGVDDSINIVKNEADNYNNGWRTCKDNPPNKAGRYLVTAKNELTGQKEVTIAMWKQRQGGSYGWFRQGVHNKVIAWQPLTEEYDEEA